MPIHLTCSCGKELKVADALAGKRGKCPRCGTVLQIPAAGAAAEVSVAAVAAPETSHADNAPASMPLHIAPPPSRSPASGPPLRSSPLPRAKLEVSSPVSTSLIALPSSPFAAGTLTQAPTNDLPFARAPINPYQAPLTDGQSPFAPGAVITADLVPYGSAAARDHQLSRFPLWALLLLNYATMNIFVSIWLLLMHGKMPKLRPNDPGAGKAIGFAFIPVFNIFYWSFFVYGRLLTRINEQRTMRGLPAMHLHVFAMTLCALLIITPIPFLGWALGGVTGWIMFPILASMIQNGVNQLVEVTRTGKTSVAGIRRIVARHNRGFCLLWGLFLGLIGGVMALAVGGVMAIVAAQSAEVDPDGTAFLALLITLAVVMVSFWLPAGLLLFRAHAWNVQARQVA